MKKRNKMEKSYNGKAIYKPKGKAGEYAEWACNFYVGCSNNCEYCFNKKGRGAKILGGNKPELKKCFKDEEHALKVFEKELLSNIEQLKEHGLFFSFTTDPMLGETSILTMSAVEITVKNNVPIKILTKCAENTHFLLVDTTCFHKYKNLIAIGFTLTGHDELERGASTNKERIRTMKILHNEGFKTFASIEPIIDFESSMKMIESTLGYCDLYKIGLERGKRYDRAETFYFMCNVVQSVLSESLAKVYFKENMYKESQTSRELFNNRACVDRHYNLFNHYEKH